MATESNQFHLWHGYGAAEGQTSDDLRDADTLFVLLLDGCWVEPDGYIENADGQAVYFPYYMSADGLSDQCVLTGIWFFEGRENLIRETMANFP